MSESTTELFYIVQETSLAGERIDFPSQHAAPPDFAFELTDYPLLVLSVVVISKNVTISSDLGAPRSPKLLTMSNGRKIRVARWPPAFGAEFTTPVEIEFLEPVEAISQEGPLVTSAESLACGYFQLLTGGAPAGHFHREFISTSHRKKTVHDVAAQLLVSRWSDVPRCTNAYINATAAGVFPESDPLHVTDRQRKRQMRDFLTEFREALISPPAFIPGWIPAASGNVDVPCVVELMPNATPNRDYQCRLHISYSDQPPVLYDGLVIHTESAGPDRHGQSALPAKCPLAVVTHVRL